ncbi:MAG: 2-oxoacid:acceptor oxidoreductase family protein [Desulfurococcales archaeon]|nr:2-oxoacid:acceptor oxidoreductase family protein [Desulfurococcales archaeon]
MMIEIRWHGRGGQGAVTASEAVSAAAILDGRYALAFPEFGAERRGAPVRAYTRISDDPVIPRTPVTRPDIIVILDPSLMHPEYMEGLKPNGVVVANTPLPPEKTARILKVKPGVKIGVIDATKLAMEVLKRPIVNTAMLGALVKTTGVVSLENVEKAIMEKFPGKIGELNRELIRRAYKETVVSMVKEEVLAS